MGDDWRAVAAIHYGVSGAHCEFRDHHSRHYFLRAAGQGCLVLSKVRKDSSRPPFELQFNVLFELRGRGVDSVRPPIRTRGGDCYVIDEDHFWFMRRFNHHEPVQFWACSALAGASARALAKIHLAMDEPGMCTPYFEPDLLAPYHRSARGFVRSLGELFDAFDDAGLEPSDRRLLAVSVEALMDEADLVLGRSDGLYGMTHHDYRPENLLVRNGRIVEIIDWDRAYDDHQLYDVAYGALQFGGRQGLWGSAMLSLAVQFVDDYLDARSRPDLRDDVLGWWLRFVVVKRLLLKSTHTAERINLLRRLSDEPALIG
ncbi:phosphotransferase [Actinomadura rudentiformis]|uniref:phosphotransferase n=1 Tax=Actinomadura rudentiformis TaxID=359158 RepID=UPI00178C465D|nr:phosphotransferase [Actinomadura rudentiformis]